METMVENISDTLADAFANRSPKEIAQWSGWYKSARAVCESLANAFEIPIYRIAGAMAWLSVEQSWESNVTMTARMVELYADGFNSPWDSQGEWSQYPEMVDAAWEALNGNVGRLSFYKSPGQLTRTGKRSKALWPNRKVRSFYRNILGNVNVATIDRHAVAIAFGNNNKAANGRFETLPIPTGGFYVKVQEAYRIAAKQFDLSLPEAQAIAWCHRRGTGE